MKVKFHNPEYPNEVEFDFGGILLINGRTVTISDDELKQYEARYGAKLKDRLLVNEFATVDGKKGEVTYLTPEEPVVEVETEPEKEGDN